MPFLKNGGLFLPVMALPKKTEQSCSSYKLQDSVCLLLQLLDESQRYFCLTKIVWITSTEIRGDCCNGIGLHFDRGDSPLRYLIESKLAACKSGVGQSQTL